MFFFLWKLLYFILFVKRTDGKILKATICVSQNIRSTKTNKIVFGRRNSNSIYFFPFKLKHWYVLMITKCFRRAPPSIIWIFVTAGFRSCFSICSFFNLVNFSLKFYLLKNNWQLNVDIHTNMWNCQYRKECRAVPTLMTNGSPMPAGE